MCGLVAAITLEDNGFSVDEFSMFEHSMVFNQMRGDDSTGVVSVDKNDKWKYLKNIGGWKDIVRDHGWSQIKSNILNDGRLAFGHGRSATRGTINIANAHPFHIPKHPEDANSESIVFVHNGTLEWNQPLPGMFKHDVDSMWLGKMIAEHGAEKALSEIKGAIACMWFDTEDKTFNFYRNTERPLHWMSDKEGRFWINSEKAILEYLNIKFKLGIKTDKIYMLKEQLWFKTPINGKDMAAISDVKIVPAKVSYWDHRGSPFDGTKVHYLQPEYNQKPPEDKDFWNRQVSTIEWVNGEKIVRYHNSDVVKYKDSPPPEPDLLRMYEINNSGDVQKVFSKDGKLTYELMSFADYKKVKETGKESVVKNLSTKGTVVRFSTRMPPKGIKVKHRGETANGNSNHAYLNTYTNSVDGTVCIGERVIIEVIGVEDREIGTNTKYPMVRVIGSRVKQKQDMYIDCVFFSTMMSKEEVTSIGFFEGTISSIRLKSKEEIDEDKDFGSLVICTISSPKAVDHNTEPVKITAAEGDNEKTVH